MHATVQRADSARIRYYADGVGEPVLLIHGIGSTSRSFTPLSAHLATTHRTLALDLRGYGDSDDEPAAIGWQAFADDAAAVLDHAVPRHTDTDRAHVVAASAGTLTALTLCHAYPERVRSLTLIGPTLGDAADPTTAAQRLAERRQALQEVREGAARRAARMAGPDADEAALAVLRSEHARIRPAGYGVVAELLACTDAAPLIATLPAPIQVVVGEYDAVTGPPVAHRVRELAPEARVVTLPRVGHAPHVEQPGATATLVRSFGRGCTG